MVGRERTRPHASLRYKVLVLTGIYCTFTMREKISIKKHVLLSAQLEIIFCQCPSSLQEASYCSCLY
jgi:hypothetical protein